MEQNTLSGEKWYNNPRHITKSQFTDLKENLELLGDLSGVVHDLNTNMYVSGNQRSEVFGPDAQIIFTEKFDTPTKTGTVALGYILYNEEKYAYRQVRWNEGQCERAVITANALGGSWDKDILANEWTHLPLGQWIAEIPNNWTADPEPVEKYDEKEIYEPLVTQHTCPSCGFKF